MNCGRVEEHLDADGNRVSLNLRCSGDCGGGLQCRSREKTDHQGITRHWCVCSAVEVAPDKEDEPQGCHIVVILDPPDDHGRRKMTMDCGGGCGKGKDCKLRELERRPDVDGGVIVVWACDCVKAA